MAGSVSGAHAEEWRERFARHAISKRTIEEFCVLEGIAVSSFYRWRAKLRQSGQQKSKANDPRSNFSPVRLVGSSNTIVELPGGTRLEIPMSDSDAFERALDVVVRADARRIGGGSC